MQRALVLALFLLIGHPGALRAAPEEGRTWSTPVLFRVPDSKSRQEIRELIGSKHLGSSTDGERKKARTKLTEFGEWAVPELSKSVMGRGKARVRMNAAIVLVRIGSRRGIDPLGTALAKGGDAGLELVIPALGLGLFQRPRDIAVLDAASRKYKSRSAIAALLALAKMPGREPERLLRAYLDDMPRRPGLVAAARIATTLVFPDEKPEVALASKDRVVRMAAAVCVCLRPSAAARDPLLKLIEKAPRERDEVRTLQIHALAALPRDESIRNALLKLAQKSGKRSAARWAALMGLCDERGHKEDFPKLARLLRDTDDRNPAMGALLTAIVRTGHEEATPTAMRVLARHKASSFAAACALLVEFARATDKKVSNAGIDELVNHRRDAKTEALQDLLRAAGSVALAPLADRTKLVRETLRALDDEFVLDHWWRDRDQRAFVLLHRFLPRLFELDEIVERADPSRNAPGLPGGIAVDPNAGGPGSGDTERETRKPARANPEEQDVFAFLDERPYFAREDRRERTR